MTDGDAPPTWLFELRHTQSCYEVTLRGLDDAMLAAMRSSLVMQTGDDANIADGMFAELRTRLRADAPDPGAIARLVGGEWWHASVWTPTLSTAVGRARVAELLQPAFAASRVLVRSPDDMLRWAESPALTSMLALTCRRADEAAWQRADIRRAAQLAATASVLQEDDRAMRLLTYKHLEVVNRHAYAKALLDLEETMSARARALLDGAT